MADIVFKEQMTLSEDADVAWGFSKPPAAEARRKLVFDADFWTSLHVETQTRMAAGPWPPPDFFDLLCEALCVLESHDATAMLINFRRFPAAAEKGVRKLRVGQIGYLYWRFATDVRRNDSDIYVFKFCHIV